jgi:hypothetical protein
MAEKNTLERWKKDIEKTVTKKWHPEVQRLEEKRKKKISLRIWLAGPGRDHEFYHVRKLIGEFLKAENFEVYFSEDFSNGGDLVSKEVREIEAFDMAIILAMSPGSSAEAVEFAYYSHIRNKFFVFIPEEYKDGYVFRSITRHRLIGPYSLFSLKRIRRYDSELARNVFMQALNFRDDFLRKKKMRDFISDS